MDFYVTGVNHQELEFWLVNQLFQKVFPHSLVAPAAESAMCIFPISITRRQVSPRGSGAQNPEDSVDEFSIIPSVAAPGPLSPGQVLLQQVPNLIRYIVSLIIFFRLHGAPLFCSYNIAPIY